MFNPQYNQPFTIEEAFALDPPIITEEISRLQNSIRYLERSNTDLVDFLKSETDPDVALFNLGSALLDNKVTIAAQSERIQILQIALGSKLGIRISDSHYAPNPIQNQSISTNRTSTVTDPTRTSAPPVVSTHAFTLSGSDSRADDNPSQAGDVEENSGEGVYL